MGRQPTFILYSIIPPTYYSVLSVRGSQFTDYWSLLLSGSLPLSVRVVQKQSSSFCHFAECELCRNKAVHFVILPSVCLCRNKAFHFFIFSFCFFSVFALHGFCIRREKNILIENEMKMKWAKYA